MAMGKRKRRAQQTSMWEATQDLPRGAAHPSYTRLNQILDKHDFDGYVKGLCEQFYADEGRPGLPPGRYFRADPSRVLTEETALPDGEYEKPDQRWKLFQQLDDRLSRNAGLVSASIASTRPFVGGPSRKVSFSDRPTAPSESLPMVAVVAVGPRYFDTLRVAVLRG